MINTHRPPGGPKFVKGKRLDSLAGASPACIAYSHPIPMKFAFTLAVLLIAACTGQAQAQSGTSNTAPGPGQSASRPSLQDRMEIFHSMDPEKHPDEAIAFLAGEVT